MVIPTNTTASGAPLIARAFATTRSVIGAKRPGFMFETAAVIDGTGSWLTRKQVGPPLRPKYRYSLCDPRSPEDHQRENVRIDQRIPLRDVPVVVLKLGRWDSGCAKTR